MAQSRPPPNEERSGRRVASARLRSASPAIPSKALKSLKTYSSRKTPRGFSGDSAPIAFGRGMAEAGIRGAFLSELNHSPNSGGAGRLA